ncbi:NAD-dependent epimerase/dehydratase family protein [Pseudomonas sp. AM4(2022)]|uniref:NAD-dependent epimerase/dehydratase family protein n=1 Tax=Pseudomonas sp. AM4(2022) TaxID=2983408 RepID=UPI002E7FB71D|nr:NAD-dependent epimerase/dehydratase family protein [Pseudomonas sp. AM4(2022)]
MKFGVTGAAGFIGRRLCEALIDKGEAVNALTRRVGLDLTGVDTYLADLSVDDDFALDAFLDDVDVVFHCAGELKRDELMYSLHVEGTKRLLAAVGRQCTQKKRNIHWVQLSSVGAYGPPPGRAGECRVVSEESVPAPRGMYEVTKTISDELVLSYSRIEHRFTCSVIRPSNVIGAGMPNQSFFQMANIVRRGMFFYIGSGESISTYVHVDDLVAALIACSTDKRAFNKVYLLSNDCLLHEVIGAIAQASGVKAPFVRVPEFLMRMLVGLFSRIAKLPLTHERINALVIQTRYASDAIERELGFRFSKSIPDAIPEILSKPVAALHEVRP